MTLNHVVRFFRERDDFLVLTHQGPDADGLGAAYALVLALRKLGKRSIAALSGTVPRKFAFIDQRGLFVSLPEDLNIHSEDRSIVFDLAVVNLIIVDTHDFDFLGPSARPFLAGAKSRFVIDHHELCRKQKKNEFIDSKASSTSELVYLITRELGVELSNDAAEALFAGIVYDTGSFAYPKTSERTFACAQELVKNGVKPYSIHNKLYESSSKGSLLLKKSVLSSLEIIEEGRVAVQSLGRAELAASGSSYEDSEDLVNIPLQEGRVEVSVFFKENMEGELRCSLRSKGQVNVARVAHAFGGGGHKTAAGFSCLSPLESIKADVLQTIGAALQEIEEAAASESGDFSGKTVEAASLGASIGA